MRPVWLPLLLEYVMQTSGPILVLNGGRETSVCLAAVCQPGRIVATSEPGPILFPGHLPGQIPAIEHWNLVLADPSNPVECVRQYSNADLIFVPNCSGLVEEEVKKFKYHRRWGWLQPATAVVSHTVNVRNGGG